MRPVADRGRLSPHPAFAADHTPAMGPTDSNNGMTRQSIRLGKRQDSRRDLRQQLLPPFQPTPSASFGGQQAPLIGSWLQAPDAGALLLTFQSQAMHPPPPAQAGLHEGRDRRGSKPMEEDMKVLIVILRLRLSRRMPASLHFRMSISISDVSANRGTAPVILSRLRWTLSVCRAPPE